MLKILVSHEFKTAEEAQHYLSYIEAYDGEKSAAPPAEKETPTTTDTQPDEKPKGRRGRKPKPEYTEPETSEAKEEKPKGRRGRKSKKDTAADPDDIPTEKVAAKDEKISDADVSKAASEAAEKIGVDPVLEIIEEFQVEKDGKMIPCENVNQLDQEQRKEFLEILRKEQNPDEEKKKW